MVYREPAEELARQAAAAAAVTGPLTTLDASGRPGQRGIDGATGESGEGDGHHGRQGGDAREAEPGERGGSIVLVLERATGASAEHVAHLHGHVASSRGEQRVDHEVDFDRAGEIELIAHGGRGGDGGNGGNGGRGARGHRGRDASSIMSGGDGGRGGDGGDGGSGTSGARGGDGGNLVVRVRDTDTHLLMLLARDVRGGQGGASGQNGGGGAGGRGGPGGSSYSWTSSETYTDAQGNLQSRSVSHHHSGGGPGPAGRNGRSGDARLHDGAAGQDGAFTIEVLDASARPTKYPGRYDVRLVSLHHRNDNDDGIYEPEERVFVSRLEVENVGGMPTPEHHDIRVGLVDDGWIAPAGVHLSLPRSLPPGRRHVFESQELELRLRVFRPQESGRPLGEEAIIGCFADLPAARRRFHDFESADTREQRRLFVRFPIEATPLVSLFSLAPGQAARVRWSITNVSTKAFGTASELRRAVSVYVGVASGSGLGANQLHFFDENEQRVPLDVGFRRAVTCIEPGQTIAFEGTIAVDESASTYTSARLFLALELGHIDEPAAVRPIQYQEVTVTVGRPFEARDADVLFITNNRSTGEEIAAWEAFAKRLGLSSAVWDASLEGGVDVLRAVARGERHYRLVVLLDNTMDTAMGERRASALLDKETSLALARASTHVFYVGRFPDLDALVVPLPDAGGAGPPASVAFDATREALLAACEAEEIGGAGVSIDVRASYAWPWSIAKEEHLVARARACARALEARWPERRYVVVPRWELALEKKVAWVRVMRLGRLVVRRTLDPARGAVSGIAVDAKEMHEPSFVADPRTVGAAVAALPFEAKLGVLTATTSRDIGGNAEGNGGGDPVVAAVLGNLVREQQLVAAFRWRASKEELARAMPMLDAFARSAFPEPTSLASDSGKRLVELAAWLELVARGHARWWEWVPPLVWLRRGTVLRAFVRDVIARVLSRAAAGDAAALVALRKAVESRLGELRSTWKARRRAREAPATAAQLAAEEIAARGTGRRIESDAGRLVVGGRVLEASVVDALAEKERGRRARSAEVVEGAARAKGELGRVERCAELLARADADAEAEADAEADADAEAEADAEADADADAEADAEAEADADAEAEARAQSRSGDSKCPR